MIILSKWIESKWCVNRFWVNQSEVEKHLRIWGSSWRCQSVQYHSPYVHQIWVLPVCKGLSFLLLWSTAWELEVYYMLTNVDTQDSSKHVKRKISKTRFICTTCIVIYIATYWSASQLLEHLEMFPRYW